MNSLPGIASLAFFVAAILSAISGKTLVKNRKGWLYKEDEPGYFWTVVGIYAFMGVFMLFVAVHFRAAGG